MTTVLELTPTRPVDGTPADTAEWPVWSTTARLVVTDPDALSAATDRARDLLTDIDRAASRFRDDSEIRRLDRAGGAPTLISDLLADLIAVALDAAHRTDGDVDPGLGNGMRRLGYDRDLSRLGAATAIGPIRIAPSVSLSPFPMRALGPAGIDVVRAVSWRDVVLDRDRNVVTVPASVSLDLGATAKAFASDLIARTIAADLGTGVLVSLGGDIATAGRSPDGGWRIRVDDGPGEPSCAIALPAGSAIATSSTIRRRWSHDDRTVHHILDPRTQRPARPVWRTVTVAAPTCVLANTLTTAAVVRGGRALGWLATQRVPGRLVAQDGTVSTLGGWPAS